MFRKFPDDPEIENMNPVMRAWMFHNWIEDFHDEYKVLENQSYLIGSFINPELVKRILGKDGREFESDDTAYEDLLKQIRQKNELEDKSLKKRQRKRKLKLKG